MLYLSITDKETISFKSRWYDSMMMQILISFESYTVAISFK
jgi:hypothetical protein